MDSRKTKGILFILLAGACWGSIGIFVRRLGAAGLGSMEIVALRSIFTVIFMFLFLMVYDRSLFRIRFRDLWCFAGTGIFSMVFFNYCYFRLITISSLSVAAVMLYTAPVFVMLMSAVLFRERITPVKLIALAESLGGVESLACHPSTMTHASIPRDLRLKVGISDNLIRLSPGIEAAEDLVNDLDQAIKASKEG